MKRESVIIMIKKMIVKIKKMSLSKVYLSTLGAFILGFFIIFISPIFTGRSYSYEETVMNEYETLGNSVRIALVKKEYNPEKKLMRLDFNLLEENSFNSLLSNIDYDVSSRHIKNSKEPLDVKKIRVNDNYLVVIINNIPEHFSVVSTTISPKYIHPELQENDDLNDKKIKIYVNESDKIINKNLKVGTKKDYEKEYIVFRQQSLKEKIKSNEDKINTKKLAISELDILIKDLEIDQQYQTEEEKFETNTEINSHKSNIIKYENEIEKLNIENDEMREKIKLLEEKKENI